MYTKIAAFVALLSMATSVAATPPACLIGAVTNTTNPADIKSICNSPDSVNSYLSANCDNQKDTAVSAFSSICKDAGVTISTSATSSSATSSGSSSVSSGSASVSSTNVSSSGSSNSASITGSSSASATSSGTPVYGNGASSAGNGAYGSMTPAPTVSPKPASGAAARLGMDCVGLLALGSFGLMLAL